MVVKMAAMDDHERKIVVEFCHLLDKSKNLFNGLRDLPQYGHKQWQTYFGRTFDVYTKLWKFQQQHRQILDTKYGLKRWQIGEIASKIGQLYYHYYLRTSETNYLNEAFSFYSAIRGRAYYSRASKEDRSDLMVKKLRYYARFIVVCLLLKKMKLVRDLVVELDKQIVDYTSTYEPDDQLEWSLVLEEIKSFIKADGIVSVLHADSNTIVLSHRLSPLTTPPVEKSTIMNLSLQEIVIIGNCSDQVKFSELTMDMFRMLQTLEREPQEDYNHLYDSPAPGRVPFEKSYSVSSAKGGVGYPSMVMCQENGDRPSKRENPHKYLLYKPTFSQIMVFLASGFKELPANGALLLYISADGCFGTAKHPEDMGYDLGGVVTNSKREPELSNKKGSHAKDMHCLYPGDLYPFTRKPFFVIVDSDNSFVFQHLPRYFGQPLVILMSPQDIPPNFHEQQHNGNLFTMFLHSPLTAFCYICNITNVPIHHWERCQSFIDRFVTEASRLLTRSRIDPVYLQFFGDDFLRLLVLRYVFCDIALHLHRSFKYKSVSAILVVAADGNYIVLLKIMETIQVVISTSLKDEISTACVWDAYNGTLLARYRGGGFCTPHGLCFSGGYLLSCEKGKPLLHLWQLNKQHCENKRLIAPGKVSAIAFSTDWLHIAVAVSDKVHLYQTSSGRLLGTGSRHFQPVTVMTFCDDSTLLCCGGEDGLVTVWNISTFSSSDHNAEPFVSFSEHTLPVTDLVFFSGSLTSRVMSVSIDRTCKIYDLATEKVILSIVFEAQLTSVALSPIELELYVGNSEGTIREVSLRSPPRMIEVHATDKVIKAEFLGHEKAVNCLVCTIDSCHLISGSEDETIKIWHINSHQCLRTIPQKGPVTNILSLLLPKTAFAHDFKPQAFIHDFLNPANIEEDEEHSFEIMVSENLLPSPPPEIRNVSASNNNNEESFKKEINTIKSINNTMYKFAVNTIFKMPGAYQEHSPSSSSPHGKPKKKKTKKKIKK